MKKTFALILALVMALVLLAGCGSSSGTGTATGEKAVTFSLLNGPISLDPATTVDGASLMVEIQLYNTLVNSKCGNSPEITPELATDWTVSDDGLTYTFHLRDDVTFHDGSQFTSADAVYTFERVMKEPYTSYLAVMIDSVEAPDSGTFVVHLLYPYADFLTTIGGIYFGICREDAITSSSDFMYKPVGTGPYMLEGDYVPGQAFNFVYKDRGHSRIDRAQDLLIGNTQAEQSGSFLHLRIQTGDLLAGLLQRGAAFPLWIHKNGADNDVDAALPHIRKIVALDDSVPSFSPFLAKICAKIQMRVHNGATIVDPPDGLFHIPHVQRSHIPARALQNAGK